MTESTARAERYEPKSSVSPFYLWEVPQKPVSVRIPFALIDRLENEAVESFRSLSSRGSEIGGILFGGVSLAEPLLVSIEEYELISCDYSRGPLYRLADADMARFDRAIAQKGNSSNLVGFFRSHTRKGLSLDPDDVTFFDARFPDPYHIVMLVRPFATKPSSAGIFIREGDKIQSESSYLEFPFRSSLLTPGKLPEPQEPSNGSTISLPSTSLPKTTVRAPVVPIASRREVTPAAPVIPSEPAQPVAQPQAKSGIDSAQAKREPVAPPPSPASTTSPTVKPAATSPAPSSTPATPVKPAVTPSAPPPSKPASSASAPAGTPTAKSAPATPAPAATPAKPASTPTPAASASVAAPPKEDKSAKAKPAPEAPKPAAKAAPVETKAAPVEAPVKPAATPAKAVETPAKAVETPLKSPDFVKSFESPEAAGGRSKMLWIALGGIAAVVGLIAFLVFPSHKKPTIAPQDSSQLSLRVERSAGEILLTWNRDADAIRSAKSAVLVINDGDQHENVDMDLSQLKNGSISYSPATTDVVFRMEVTGKDGSKTASESLHALQPRPSPLAGEPASVGPNNAKPNTPNTPAPNTPNQPTPLTQSTPNTQTPATTAQAPAPNEPNAQEQPKQPERVVKPFQSETLAQRLHPVTTQTAELPDAPALSGRGAASSSSLPSSLGNIGALPAPPPTAPAPAPAPASTTPANTASKAAPQSGGQIIPAQLLKRKEPEYPKLARDTGAKGVVELIATIGTDGKVKKVRVVHGPPMLTKAAADAVMQWQYRPTMLNGVPVEAETQVLVNFLGDRQ